MTGHDNPDRIGSPSTIGKDANPGSPVEQPAPCPTDSKTLAEGLVAEHRPIAAQPAVGTSACLDAVRADLAHFDLRVLTSAQDGPVRTAPAWLAELHLTAVINAGMFHSTNAPVGLIVEHDHVIGSDNAKMSGFIAFDPRSPSDPPAVMTGRKCAGFDLADLRKRYRSIVQSYRLLDCAGAAMPWADPKQYSAAAIGVDRKGRVVFIHARSAVTMTELSTAVAALDLTGALFLEGGPEASLVVHAAKGELSRVGSYETNFVENDDNVAFWDLPNVIGLLPRP
jgi:hypothetical protein